MDKLPLSFRMNCQYLQVLDGGKMICESDGLTCDGRIYDTCQPERCFYNSLSVCGYPIDDCENCPIHPKDD